MTSPVSPINRTLVTKFFTKVSSTLASPHQRFVLGVTSLASQPFIDYYNKDVDEQTRKYSVARTVVKILVGTTVGVTVRALSIRTANKLIKAGFFKPLNKLDAPKKRELYANTLGDILGLMTTFCTNFLIDAPLTKFGLNYLAQKYDIKNSEDK